MVGGEGACGVRPQVHVSCGKCQAIFQLNGSLQCKKCGAKIKVRGGVIDLLDDADRGDPVLGSYYGNYDQIASDDLATPVLNEQYVLRQAENLLSRLGSVKNQCILDLGCGQGKLSKALAAAGAKHIFAVDISIAYLQRLVGVSRVTPMLANAERLPFRGDFDLVVCTDVMEHVLNVGSFLVSVNWALREGGTLAVRVPLAESLIPYSSQAGCKYKFVHLRSFNFDLMKRTLSEAGFEIVAFYKDGFSIQSPQKFWMQTPRRFRIYNKAQQYVKSRLSDESEVTSWYSWFAALFMQPKEMIAIARKVSNLEMRSPEADRGEK